MMVGRLCLVALLAFGSLSFGQRKQIQELQRDMALLQDQIRTTNDKLATLTLTVEETLDRVNKTNTAVAVLDQNLSQSMAQQQNAVAAPIAILGAKVDGMSNEFRFVRESVADLSARVGKLQTQLIDLKNTMQVMSAPPPPPVQGGLPPATQGDLPPARSSPAADLPPVRTAPSASAEDTFNNARRDQSGGRMDMSLAQYKDYLRDFPNTDLAPVAQYSIGEIYYIKGEYEQAQQAFDLVLEKYPENERTADAMYMKGMSLARAGQSRSAARELRALLKKYPDSGLAAKAEDELTNLGYAAR